MNLVVLHFTNLLVLIILLNAARTSKGTTNVIDARGKGVSRDAHNGIAFAKFKAHKFSYLNITSLGTDYVVNGRECGLACVNIPSCFSFNLAAFSDIKGRIFCELLPSDKYNNSDKFVTSQFFHHFSIGHCTKVWECFDVFQLVTFNSDGIALFAIQAHRLGFAGVNAKPNNLTRMVEAGCLFLHVAMSVAKGAI
ncbi:hypothetical protein ACROYT_G010763 [Oculina patagonica]